MCFQSDEVVRSCVLIERGLRITPDGINCCCGGGMLSPLLITADELSQGRFSFDLLVERRRNLFMAINGKGTTNPGMCMNCALVKEKKFADVDFEHVGGVDNKKAGASSFILGLTNECNMRCIYCSINKNHNFVPLSFDMVSILEKIKNQDRSLYSPNIELLGGEPTILPEFDSILAYLINNKFGHVYLTSNSLVYKQCVYDYLAQNQISLITSLDAGTPSSFKKIRGSHTMHRVMDNLIRYRNSGTRRMFLKYIIGPWNLDDDNLYGFLFFVCAIKPNFLIISLDVSLNEYSKDMVLFGAKLYLLVRKYINCNIVFYSDGKTAKKFNAYSRNVRNKIEELKKSSYYCKLLKIASF